MEKTVNQAISLDGSELYEVKGTSVYSGQVTMYSSLSGIGGQPFVPYEGATVYLASNVLDSSDDVRKFELSLNNKAYFLVSNIKFTNDQTQLMFELATEVAMSYDGDLNRYVGTFTYTNPDNYPYLYLIWNYTDNAFGGTAYYNGNESNGKKIYVDFTDQYGFASIDYNVPEGTVGFTLEWNGSIVYDTGLVSTSGTIPLNKYLPTSGGILSVYSEDNTYAEFNIIVNTPIFYTFFIPSVGADDYSTSCTLRVTDTMAGFVGSGSLPTVGDRIYDLATALPFDGGNKYYTISEVYQTSPNPLDSYALIDNDGIVQQVGSCSCGEVAEPTIDQEDLDFIIGQPVNVQVNASNNPTSWAIVSDYKKYSVTGGTKGSIWTITNLDATTTNVVVNINTTSYVSSTVAPTLAFGDGTFEEVAVDQSNLLPKGLSFDTTTGVISGTPTTTSDYAITLTATNCAGTSTEYTLNVSVSTGIDLTPFAIDVENFTDTDAGACAVSPIYSLLYHNGKENNPVEKDIVYIDYRARDPFMGGSRWYIIDNGATAIQIDEIGNVIGTYSCAIP